MKYNARFFKENFPEWKRNRDTIFDRYIYRPISFYLSALCANLGIQANTVSNISTLVGILSCILIAIPYFATGIVGTLFMILWIVMDDTDGNLARNVKKQAYGEYLDAMSSYILIGIFFFAIGHRSYHMATFFPNANELYLLMGGLASIFGILMSLLYQKFIVVSKEMGLDEKLAYDGSNSSKMMKLKTKIDLNLSVGGILPILTLLGCLMNKCEFIVILWFLYHTAEFIATAIYFIIKAKRYNVKITKD